MRVDATLIGGPDELTAPWIADALVRSGAAPAGATIAAIDQRPIGNGKVGESVRVTITWAGSTPEGAPTSLVAKFAASDPRSRMAGLVTGTYVREVAFYRELAPIVGGRSPDCHVAEIDPTTGALVLLLEDLAPARTGDQIAGCGVDDAALAIELVADLHASMWDDPRLAGRDWLMRRDRDDGEGLANLYDGLVDPFCTQFADRLSPLAVEVAQGMRGRVPGWIGHDAALPPTLLHGDYRLENLLFGTGGSAPAVAVVDWQTPNVGPGPSDVAYLLGGGLAPADRRASERDLVELYRGALAARGVELDEESCWSSYATNACTGLHMTVVASVLVARDARSDEMFLAMAERHATHVDDLGTLGLLDS